MKIKNNSLVTFLLFIPLLIITACNKNTDIVFKPIVSIPEILKAKCDSVVENTDVPGMVVGVWDKAQRVDMVHATGLSNKAASTAMDQEMLFRIGSNTKTFTVTVMLQLIEEGLLNTEDSLSHFFPDFPRSEEVDIRMLADMHSGIHSYTEADEFFVEFWNNPMKVWTSDELIGISALYPYHFDPGQQFNYCNTNTVMIGSIIETLTGNTLEEEIHSRIINPLGLQHTYYLSSGNEMPGYHAHGYFIDDFDPEWPDITEHWDISWAQAAGGMVSNVQDLKTYVEAMVKGGLLNDSVQQLRLNSLLTIVGDSAYGMGLFSVHGFMGHNGGLPGFTSVMMHSLQKDATIIILYNCQLNAHRPDDLFLEFIEVLYPGEF